MLNRKADLFQKPIFVTCFSLLSQQTLFNYHQLVLELSEKSGGQLLSMEEYNIMNQE